MKNAKRVKALAVVVAVFASIAATVYCEKLFIVTMPSGNRELYHGFASYFGLFGIFVVVAIATYKVFVRLLHR